MLLACLLACAANDDDDDDDDDGIDLATPATPECGSREAAVAGIVDGESWEYAGDLLNYQAGGTGWAFGGDVSLAFTLEQAAEVGVEVRANGWVDLGEVGGPAVGNCEGDGYVSTFTVTEDGDGAYAGTFLIRDVRFGPSYCNDDVHFGAVAGCFDY